MHYLSYNMYFDTYLVYRYQSVICAIIRKYQCIKLSLESKGLQVPSLENSKVLCYHQ